MKHVISIIPLMIEAKSQIIQNNLPEFRELVTDALSKINRDLKSDEEFGQAEQDVKSLKEFEDSVRSAAVKAFDDQLKALVDGLNETAEEIRVPRLELEKIIAKRKEEVKTEIVEEFLAKFDIDPKDARKNFLAGLQSQIKGKRTVESMKTACRVYHTTQQAIITNSRDSIERFIEKFGPDLVMDRRELELKPVESVEAELVRRVEAKKADEEKKVLQKAADDAKTEAAKAQAALAESSKPPAVPSNVEQGPWRGGSAPVEQPVASATATTSAAPAAGPEEEWSRFKAACLEAFKGLKPSREALKHPENVAKAQAFADALNAAWQIANRKEVA